MRVFLAKGIFGSIGIIIIGTANQILNFVLVSISRVAASSTVRLRVVLFMPLLQSLALLCKTLKPFLFEVLSPVGFSNLAPLLSFAFKEEEKKLVLPYTL